MRFTSSIQLLALVRPWKPRADVSQSDVDRERYTADGRPRDPYTDDMIGTPEWGEQHTRQPERDGSNWGAPYRWIGSAMLGHALAARLTPGAVQAWNRTVFFEYMDRFFATDTTPTTNTNGIQSFQREMWEAYRDTALSEHVARPESPVITVE